MLTRDALLQMHERGQRNWRALLEHCRQFGEEELNRKIPGFGYPTVRLQLHHAIAAQDYWFGVLRGEVNVDETDQEYLTVAALEAYLDTIDEVVRSALGSLSDSELNTARSLSVWAPGGNQERPLVPAEVFLRTFTHYYHHQGQVLAMCRILGKPGGGCDYPLSNPEE